MCGAVGDVPILARLFSDDNKGWAAGFEDPSVCVHLAVAGSGDFHNRASGEEPQDNSSERHQSPEHIVSLIPMEP